MLIIVNSLQLDFKLVDNSCDIKRSKLNLSVSFLDVENGVKIHRFSNIPRSKCARIIELQN